MKTATPNSNRRWRKVLCVYREVAVLKKTSAKSKKQRNAVAIVSCDEKPGIQAIATTAPDLPPEPGVHATFARDHEYKRHGTLSLLAGIDLLTGKVHALVRDRYRSREFIEFLKLLDTAYPARTAIKLILDNHSTHISRETTAWLATRPAGRFEFTFTPKHGSWLNLIEGCAFRISTTACRTARGLVLLYQSRHIAIVNAPPPKGGGFRLRLKVGSVRHSADLGHLEIIIGLRRHLAFDVLHPDLISNVAAARNPVAPRPQVLTPVAFAQNPELAQQLVRTPSL